MWDKGVNRSWKPSEVNALSLLAEQGWGIDAIAAQLTQEFKLKVTRNSVAGQCHRRGVKLCSPHVRAKKPIDFLSTD